MKKHWTNLFEEYSTKLLPYNLQKHQVHKNERLSSSSSLKETKKTIGYKHNPFVIKEVSEVIGEASVGFLGEEYRGVCYNIFTTFWDLESGSK